MTSDKVVGTWQLCTCTLQQEDGTCLWPFGVEAKGYLLYASDGVMAVAIMSERRELFRNSDIVGGTLTEKAQAASTYLSYSGRYTVTDDKVLHHVEVSLFPNWVGTVQERRATLIDGLLTLRADVQTAEGKRLAAEMTWRRPAPASSDEDA